MDNQKNHWEMSFKKKDNFVFSPHEEVIRFFAKYVSKRKGLNEFEKVHAMEERPKVLDLGCGIGRHIIFSNAMQTDAYGVDLSESAVKFSIDWAKKEGIKNAEEKILQLYFNKNLIEKIFSTYFDIVEMILIKRNSIYASQYFSRYHLVLKKVI
jgi:cyclopropane fatty-acyl-phospholipid synthase-like methyltransferase